MLMYIYGIPFSLNRAIGDKARGTHIPGNEQEQNENIQFNHLVFKKYVLTPSLSNHPQLVI